MSRRRFIRLPQGGTRRIERDVDDELRFHLEMRERELVEGGMTHEMAHAHARVSFGDLEYTRRYLREVDMRYASEHRRSEWIAELWQDARYAVRQLVRAPGFTVVALVTLALGIGANTAIFSVVNGVLLKPLPFAEPEGVIRLFSLPPKGRSTVSAPDFLDWRRDTRTFEHLAAWWDGTTNLSGDGAPERLSAARVTSDFFGILRVPATIGRTFVAGDDDVGAPSTAVLGATFWRRRFGGDPSIVGRTITLDGQPFTVIGIVAASMRFPPDVDLWLPLVFSAEDRAGDNRGGHWLNVIGRLRPRVTIERASAEMATIGSRLERLYPDKNTNYRIELVTLQDSLVGDVKRPLYVLLGAVGLVMLIACANVANLLLVRTAARETEVAVRRALGAGRGRLLRQLLTESAMLAVLGGALGFGVAVAATRMLLALAPADIPRLDEVHVDGLMLGLTLGVAVVTGIAFGLVPALQGSSPQVAQRLRDGARGSRGRPASRRLRSLLTVSELALAVMLLAGAGLLIRSFGRLQSVDPGFNPAGTVSFAISLPTARYDSLDKQHVFGEQLLARMRALPRVQSAALAMGLPLGDTRFSLTFEIREHPPIAEKDQPSTQIRLASAGFFETLSMPVRKGRAFTREDDPRAVHVVVVNEEFVRRHFPNENPIGKHVTAGWSRDSVWLGGEIVGVVGDSKQSTLDRSVLPELWVPLAQWPIEDFSVVLKTTAVPATLFAAVRTEVLRLDPNLPIFDFRTLDDLVDASVSQPRFYMLLLATFAGVALVLAAVGIYGVISYAVAQRTHEIGIRIALGATIAQVQRLVVAQGLVLAVVGLFLGLMGAMAVKRVLASLLFGISPSDPLTFAGVAVVLGLVAMAACWLPARRAARVDPLRAIRAE